MRETEQKIDEEDYPIYIQAQIDIIQSVTAAHRKDPNLQPNCLVGEKAWNRWLVWRKKYQHRLASAEMIQSAENTPQLTKSVKIALNEAKDFLTKKLEILTKDQIKAAVSSRTLLRWAATGQISPYYVLLSPILNQWLAERKLDASDILHIDLNFYRPAINEEIKSYFRESYGHEF